MAAGFLVPFPGVLPSFLSSVVLGLPKLGIVAGCMLWIQQGTRPPLIPPFVLQVYSDFGCQHTV